jgi:pyruvate kinase
MLSGETAAGKYPVETVRLMDQILEYTETYLKTKSSKKEKRLLERTF